MNSLVHHLSQGFHPVVVGGQKPSCEEFKKRIDEIHFIFLKFLDTKGGTEVGVRIDKVATNSNEANFEQGTGVVHVEGTLILNYVKLRCVADINLATLRGNGKLVVVGEKAS